VHRSVILFLEMRKYILFPKNETPGMSITRYNGQNKKLALKNQVVAP